MDRYNSGSSTGTVSDESDADDGWRWMVLGSTPDDHHEVSVGPIATLGPSGTSSEAAAMALCRRSGGDPAHTVRLYTSYEGAGDALRQGRASRLLVANAYAKVNDFYMDPELRLEKAFVFDTPGYGIAARADRPVPLRGSLATHPAPKALIGELIPPAYGVEKIELAASTSEAARLVAHGAVNLALTTEPAVRHHGLRFVSRTRTIRMLWSVFRLSGAARSRPAP